MPYLGYHIIATNNKPSIKRPGVHLIFQLFYLYLQNIMLVLEEKYRTKQFMLRKLNY